MQWYDIATIILFLCVIITAAIIIRTFIKKLEYKLAKKVGLLAIAVTILILVKLVGAAYTISINLNTPAGDYVVLIVEAIFRSLGLLFFDYDDAIIKDLALESFGFSGLYAASSFLVLGAYVWVFVSLFKSIYLAIKNANKAKRLYKVGCDIILGYDDDAITYAKNYKNTIIWLIEDLNEEKKDYLDNEGICYEDKSFDLDTLNYLYNKFVKNKNSNFNFISFADNILNLEYMTIFKKFLSQFIENDKVMVKNFTLHVEIEFKNHITIKDMMLSDKTYSSFIDCFNRYDLISQGFVEKYPITKFISKCDKEDDSFINKTKACISNGKKVNVIYIGFGRISNAIHRASVMNDQLATIENNRLVPLPINYFAFDSNKENKEDKNSVFYYEKFLSDMKNLGDEDKKEYFELPNTPCNFTFTPHNINSFEFFTSLLDILKNDIDNTFNQIIISFGSDMDNLDYALKLLELFRQYKITRFHIYIRIKSSSLTGLSVLDNNDVDFFGGDDEFINHEVIVNDELHDIAKIINGQYDLTSGFGEDWYSKTAIKQLSSIYSGLNLRLKLNLLGYDYEFKNEKSNINDHNIYFKQLASKLTNKMDLEYEEYLFDGKEFNEANALAYQEKLRWNAFYIYHGYKPMKINDIHFDDNSNRIYKDDDLLKTHGCLTTVWGLDEYHRLIAKIISEKKNVSFEDALNDTQTYKYDYMLMNNFDKLFDENSKYVLIKK